jgi:hypothetical protein
MTRYCSILTAGIAVLCISAFAEESPTTGSSANEIFCPTSLTEEICATYIKILKETTSTMPSSADAFKEALTDALKKETNNPDFLNAVLDSPAITKRLNSIPVTLNFKLLDREKADSILGLEFSYAKSFNNTIYDNSGEREHAYKFIFDLNGTVTQNAEENPKNFIETKLAFSGSNYPTFNLAEASAGLVPEYCELKSNLENKECGRLEALSIEQYFEPVGSTYYLDYGFDIGIEADQDLKAKNQTYGVFAFIAYEDFRRNTFIGLNNIKPSLSIAAESVEPSNETPRAIAGDDTSYTRLSGEFSLVIPLTKLAGIPYAFTFSYRVFEELNASDIVKGENLDSYQLRTYSLTSPTGLFISYSSGRLPFGTEDENTLELGMKVYL